MNISSKTALLSESKRQLLEIVGPAVEHTDAIQNHWAVNSMLTNFDMVLYAVDRKDIETSNTTHLQEFIERIFWNQTLCRNLQGRIEVSISGYVRSS
jgi:hypothetical protein